jgi:hypothetical protein
MVYRTFDNTITFGEMTEDARFGGDEFATLYTDEGTDAGDVYLLKDTVRDIAVYDAGNADYADGGSQLVINEKVGCFKDKNNIWGENSDPEENADGVRLYLNMIRAYDFYKALDPNCNYGQINAYSRVNIDNSCWVRGEYGSFLFGENTGYERCPDVVGHEFTHFVIGNRLLGYDMSGALDESFADVMGALIENDSGDSFYNMGEDGNGSRRTLDSSQQDGKTVADMDCYDYQGDIHKNGGIPNMVFCKLRRSKTAAFTDSELIRLYYNTMMSMYPNAKFWAAKDIMVKQCETLFGKDSTKSRAVVSAWEGVGVTEENRDDFGDLPSNQNRQLMVDEKVQGRINYAGDYDCLKFCPESTGEYTFTFERGIHQVGFLNFYVIDPSMNIIGSDEMAFKNASIAVELNRGATYYVIVKGPKDKAEYSVIVSQSRQDAEPPRLSALTVSNGFLFPVFEPNGMEYGVDVAPDTQVAVMAELDDMSGNVEITFSATSGDLTADGMTAYVTVYDETSVVNIWLVNRDTGVQTVYQVTLTPKEQQPEEAPETVTEPPEMSTEAPEYDEEPSTPITQPGGCPSEVAIKCFEAILDADVDTACMYMTSEAAQGTESSISWYKNLMNTIETLNDQLYGKTGYVLQPEFSFAASNEQINGDTATVDIQMIVSYPDSDSYTYPYTFQVTCVVENGQWRLSEANMSY